MNEISKWEREMDKPSVKETRSQPQAVEVQSAQQANNQGEFLTWDPSEKKQENSDTAKFKKSALDAKYNSFLGWCRAKLNDASDKKYFKKKVFPEAESAIKSHIINSGLDKYISEVKLNTKLAANTRALTTEEMQSQLGADWKPEIMGSNDGKLSCIDISTGLERAAETTIHEYYHQFSANDSKDPSGKIEKRRGLSINGHNDKMNEVLTQKYTLDTMKDSIPDYRSKCPYNDGVRYINHLYSFDGNSELFDRAYFKNNPSLLEQHFDYYCGKGFYQELSLHFDEVVDGDPWDFHFSSVRIEEMIKAYIRARLNSSSEETHI